MTDNYGALITFLIDYGEIGVFRKKPAKVALFPNHKAHMEHCGKNPRASARRSRRPTT
jgi:hypothetical protein